MSWAWGGRRARHLGRLILVGVVGAAGAATLAAWLSGGRLVQPYTRHVDDLTARVDDVLTTQRQLLADTSHELRTPLTTVRGNLDLLERDLPPAERAEILAESREEVDRMARLVRDLLLLSDSTSGELRRERVPLRLDLLVGEVVERVAGAEAPRHPATRATPRAWTRKTNGPTLGSSDGPAGSSSASLAPAAAAAARPPRARRRSRG